MLMHFAVYVIILGVYAGQELSTYVPAEYVGGSLFTDRAL
jgi:hypothetical protein